MTARQKQRHEDRHHHFQSAYEVAAFDVEPPIFFNGVNNFSVASVSLIGAVVNVKTSAVKPITF